MEKFVFEDRIDPSAISVEDSGHAKIVHISDNIGEGLFVALHSWSEIKGDRRKPKKPKHPDFDRLIGKKVRVTIEEIC